MKEIDIPLKVRDDGYVTLSPPKGEFIPVGITLKNNILYLTVTPSSDNEDEFCDDDYNYLDPEDYDRMDLVEIFNNE